MTFSIHDPRLICLVALALAAGCEIQKPLAADRNNPNPIAVDSAMQVRDWPQISAVYPSFSSTTGSAQVLFSPRHDLPPYQHAAVEALIFVPDVVLFPFADAQRLMPMPWAQIESPAYYLPPSYSDGPPLAPRGRNDYSGGNGVGYQSTPGRAQPNLPMPDANPAPADDGQSDNL